MSKANWQTVRFGDVAREVKDTEQDPLAKGITRYVGLADLDPDSIQLKRWSEIADSETTFTRLFRKGQILFGRRRAYQRKAAVAPFDGICSGDIIVMEAKPDKLLPELLPFLIHTDGFFDYAIQTSAGSLSPRTKWLHLAKYEFALPPLDEQRRIAEVLTAVEDLRERYSNCLECLEVLFTSISNRLIEFGLAGLNFDHGDGLPIPDNWDLVELGALIDISHGYAFKSNYFSETDSEYPVLVTPGNFALDGGLYFTEDNTKYYTGEFPKEFLLRKDDIVIVMTDLSKEAKILGNPAFIEKDSLYLQNQRIGKVVYLEPQRINLKFLYFYLLGQRFQSRIKATSSGSTVSHTSPTRIREVKISLPPIAEQKSIAAIIEIVDSERRKYRFQIEKTRIMGKALIREYLDKVAE